MPLISPFANKLAPNHTSFSDLWHVGCNLISIALVWIQSDCLDVTFMSTSGSDPEPYSNSYGFSVRLGTYNTNSTV